MAFTVSFASSIISPGFESIMSDLNVSKTVSVLPFTTYVLGLAFGPLIAAPMSETLGRRSVYFSSPPICHVVFHGMWVQSEHSEPGYSPGMCLSVDVRFFAFTGPHLPQRFEHLLRFSSSTSGILCKSKSVTWRRENNGYLATRSSSLEHNVLQFDAIPRSSRRSNCWRLCRGAIRLALDTTGDDILHTILLHPCSGTDRNM